MASEAEVMQGAKARVVRDMIRPLSVGFAVFIGYQVYTGILGRTGQERILIVGADALVAAYLAALAIVSWRRSFSLPVANALGASLGLALAGTDMTTMAVTGEVPSFPATALVLAGLGAVVLSWRWILAVEAFLWGAWVVLTNMFAGNPSHAAFIMQVSVITGLAIHWGRMRAYEQLISARLHEEKARQDLQDVNEELDRFAAVVAHDLKNPISAIRLKAATLREKRPGKEAERILGDVDRVARDMGRLVDDLLAYARGASYGSEQDAGLEQVANEVRLLFADSVSKANGEIVVAHLPDYHGPHAMLRQLLQNLVSNALLYRGEAPPRIVIAGRTLAQQVEFWVEDNGMGFDDRLAKRMFAPFQRGDVDAPGHGLGLATCKRIVTALGGTIHATSQGRGATFTVRLPRGPDVGKREEEE